MMETKNDPVPGIGVEGQRRADLGNGFYLNPIVGGDHPDPTILKDGSEYYMTFSSFLAYPGIILWHSRDLVNWTPLCAALKKNIGSVWALDLVKHGDRYFIYIPAVSEEYSSIYVIYADRITGPWSDPVDLKLEGCIDPGHAVGEDGRRYLFVNGIRRIGLSDDGLSTVGTLEKVYEPWKYPDDWVVEMFAPEGPKIFRRNDWFYLVSAVGGTSGPPTSHMVIVARSRSIHGPWEDCPFNPIVRTKSKEEKWWSRGHASVVPGPGEAWWMVYHGYENGFRTLGRQTLLDPVVWTQDDWFQSAGGDLSVPIAKPIEISETTGGFPLSDDFSTDRFGLQWSFFDPGPGETNRAYYRDQSLSLEAKGSGPQDSSPVTCVVGDRSYRVEVTVEVGAESRGGLLLFYNERMFCGVGLMEREIQTYHYGVEHGWLRMPVDSDKVRFRLTNHENVVTYHYSLDGRNWVKHPWQMEVSGMHHNVLGGFTSLKVAIFSAGRGSCRFADFAYRGLMEPSAIGGAGRKHR
jgi:xylan 1,4-beta-xylosidase